MVARGHVRIEYQEHRFTQEISSDGHRWLVEEPKALGGNHRGPDPYRHLMAALGACTSMNLSMYASRKTPPLEHVMVGLEHSRDYLVDC